MQLRPFTQDDYDQLIRWIDSDELNYLWGGPSYQFPLTKQQISAHCAKPEANAFLLEVDAKAAGFAELYRVTDDHYRICRVFIADEFRGQGLSRHMLELLISKATNELGCTKLSLAVFTHNKAAIACYRSLGFSDITVEKGSRTFRGQPWELLRMEKCI